MGRSEVATRAEDFLATPTDSMTLHVGRTNVVVANAVLAGIAAADAMCGHTQGECARGESHDEALRLLALVRPHGRRCAGDLRRLLAVKTNAQYSSTVLSPSVARDAVTWAGRLVEGMRTVLGGP